MRQLLVAGLLSAGTLGAAHAGPYSNIYFFGDSLTDIGNVQAVYAGLPHPPRRAGGGARPAL